jgi:hypothetical protein
VTKGPEKLQTKEFQGLQKTPKSGYVRRAFLLRFVREHVSVTPLILIF